MVCIVCNTMPRIIEDFDDFWFRFRQFGRALSSSRSRGAAVPKVCNEGHLENLFWDVVGANCIDSTGGLALTVVRLESTLRKLQNMDAGSEDVTNEADMPEEIAHAWAKALIDLHAKVVTQAEEHFKQQEEMETCESNSDAHPC